MKSHWVSISVLVLLVAISISSCSSGTSSPTSASTASTLDGATLVQERCSKCHPLTRVESVRYSATDWKTVVDLMISRGAQLTPEEETAVVNYLAANYGK